MPAARASTSWRSRTPRSLHNMVVCTLCSCYPWPVLGLPPVWYKSAPYRSTAVKDPRGVLADFGFELPDGTEIRVWDSTAEIRYLVLPMRPAGTEGWSERAARRPRHPRQHDRHRSAETAARGRLMDGAHDMGGVAWSGPVVPEPNEPVFHAEWERRAFAITLAMAHARRLEHRHVALCPREPAARGLSEQELLPDLARRASNG